MKEPQTNIPQWGLNFQRRLPLIPPRNELHRRIDPTGACSSFFDKQVDALALAGCSTTSSQQRSLRPPNGVILAVATTGPIIQPNLLEPWPSCWDSSRETYDWIVLSVFVNNDGYADFMA